MVLTWCRHTIQPPRRCWRALAIVQDVGVVRVGEIEVVAARFQHHARHRDQTDRRRRLILIG